MKYQNSKRWAKPSLNSLFLVFICTLVAFFIRYELHPILQGRAPFTTFILSTTFISAYCGLRYALLSTLIAAPITFYYFVEPFQSWDVPTNADLILYASYIITSLALSFTIEYLQRSRYEAELINRVSDSRLKLLEVATRRKKL